MNKSNLPLKQGMYDPAYEHDACGMGFIVDINGKESYQLVSDALDLLENMEHRGAHGADEKTGDGAGIMVQIPHAFFSRECDVLGIRLPKKGDYGVGMLFAHKYEDLRNEQMKMVEEIVIAEGQKVLGWREVPIDSSDIGVTAKSAMPRFIQIFVGKGDMAMSELEFERKLFSIRKVAEKKIVPLSERRGGSFYFPSFSSKTIVYKGMLTAEQLRSFYLDLMDLDFTSGLAMVHSRFSTNTFPSWERAHPNRYLIHNGEINTIRGNVNWMRARQGSMQDYLFESKSKFYPVIDESGSDSSQFDNNLEFLYLSGLSLPEAVMMMVPEPWEKNPSMSKSKKDFYAFNNFLMEPWDGPAAMGFSDGEVVGAVLDRNGLRPARYYVTKDGRVILSSEVGVVDILPEDVSYKGRLEPGKMLLIDTNQKRIIADEEIKETVAAKQPYGELVERHLTTLAALPADEWAIPKNTEPLLLQQKAFGYTFEDIQLLIKPMAATGVDSVGAMGIDSPLAVLSNRAQMLYLYFKQLFAQVTNPPIDGIREEIVTSDTMLIGNCGNLLEPDKEGTHAIYLDSPILTDKQLAKIKALDGQELKTVTLSLLYRVDEAAQGMERALERLFREANKAIDKGANILLLSDRGVDKEWAAIPALLAVSGLHHHLIREETRTNVGIVLESGEPREVHHFCALVGYGCNAINPYLAYATIRELAAEDLLDGVEAGKAEANYIYAVVHGMSKVLTKMGISTMRSYHGAQIFEALGIRSEVVDKYFTGTPTRIEGIGMAEIAMENKMRHASAYQTTAPYSETLEVGGHFQYSALGEEHLYNPSTIYRLQQAVRLGDYDQYKEFSNELNDEKNAFSLRQLLQMKPNAQDAIPIEDVEAAENIVKRFKTGAMSYGSISIEAHETLAIAMNRLGGKSNSGEGGEDPRRFQLDENGDSRNSAIKQVASGRFGVTSHYLVNAKEIQIKMAQGAKPGEGGQLPGQKVYPEIAKTRGSIAGVGLISPPPHHDIYSIEDLKELIFDLKNANRDARINVKLVAEAGVGTIAAGVAKAKADTILISGYDGGTGAAARTSIRNTGLPWELGLAEAHQTLVLNQLRDRVRVETDGKLLTGRDVAIACMLGAEEFGFATTPLVAIGCIMMRVCHLNTCPVGIATQDETLRKNFRGKPEHVVNFMMFVAEELREIMAKLGFRNIDEMVGRSDKLRMKENVKHWKAKTVDLSSVLYQPYAAPNVGRYCTTEQDHELEKTLDMRRLLRIVKPAIESNKRIVAKSAIRNVDRVVGTIIGSEISKKYGAEGLPEDTIQLTFVGSAGQSFGAFIPKGMTLTLEGDSNDYIGKGLSGGKIIVRVPNEATFAPEDNIIVGNVCFYGATSGKAYINGIAGERFCVRNSGVDTVVEGIGDHGCEYMTGGTVLIIGQTGRNFAAGMSGGVAYILDFDEMNLNKEMVSATKDLNKTETDTIKRMLQEHMIHTASPKAQRILANWDEMKAHFTKIISNDYKFILDNIEKANGLGLMGDEAMRFAFDERYKPVATH